MNHVIINFFAYISLEILLCLLKTKYFLRPTQPNDPSIYSLSSSTSSLSPNLLKSIHSEATKMSVSTCLLESVPHKLENIEEECPVDWLPATCPPPETPTETMEFLARSWSLSAMELSKALGNTHISTNLTKKSSSKCCSQGEAKLETLFCTDSSSPPVSPRRSEDTKELFLLHQALNQDFISNQHLLKNALVYRTIIRRKTIGRWLKDQKERKKQELRTHNARLHAAISVAGVAAAVASLTATSSPEKAAPPRNSATIAAAAALVASHCIEIAEEMGAEHDQILGVVNSAMSARSNGDVMALTAGAATALRGAATLKARLQRGHGNGATTSLTNSEDGKDSTLVIAMNFVSRGGELLKRTRKGDLHWKLVSFNINSNWQVVAKMKSKHMAGTFTKKKKCVVSGVCSDIPAWTEGEWDESIEQRAYFGIKTGDRIIEFECKNKREKEIWIEGIQHVLNCRDMF